MTTCCQLALMAGPVSDSVPVRDGSETAGLGRGLRPEGSSTALVAPEPNLDEHAFTSRPVGNRTTLSLSTKGHHAAPRVGVFGWLCACNASTKAGRCLDSRMPMQDAEGMVAEV